MRDRHACTALALLWCLGAPRPLASQRACAPLPDAPRARSVRVAMLEGKAPARDVLVRDFANCPGDSVAGFRWIRPAAAIRWNSAITTAWSESPEWKGAGANALIVAGATWRWRGLRATLAPELHAAQNAPFDTRAATQPGLSPWANPWHPAPYTMDLPVRFGDEPLAQLLPGQSELSLTSGWLQLGAATSNERWGPGRYNAVVLGAAAPGIPRAFVRTARPLRTRLGKVEWRLFGGTLTESPFFDTTRANDRRAISGAAATLVPAWAPQLTLGAERLVITPMHGGAAPSVAQGIAALTRWGQGPGNSTARDSSNGDQLTGLFAHWLSTDGRLEVYAEWALQEWPRTGREFLIAPWAGQGYVIGLQWAQPVGASGTERLVYGMEAADVEQSIVFADHPTHDFYAGFITPQGFTQRGQPLGLATGPGSSNQWLSAEWVRADSRYGARLGRVRWENDALYRQRGANFLRHDVSLIAEARAAWNVPGYVMEWTLAHEQRINYQFQNGFGQPGGRPTVNVYNLSLGVTLEPR